MKMGLIPKSYIFGADVAGRIESVGTAVTLFKVGDKVVADTSGCGFGGLADFVVIPETLLARKPESGREQCVDQRGEQGSGHLCRSTREIAWRQRDRRMRTPKRGARAISRRRPGNRLLVRKTLQKPMPDMILFSRWREAALY